MDDGGRNLLRAYTYTPDGKVSEIRDYPGFASGDSQYYIRKAYTYDGQNRVTDMAYSSSADEDTVLESYGYSYDKASNILTERIFQSYFEADGKGIQENRSHTYDSLGRLVSTEIRDFGSVLLSKSDYTYDKVGNRLTETKEGEVTKNTYNSLNQMTASNTTTGSTVKSDRTCTYDANGNLIKESDSITKESTEYSYDVANRLSQAKKTSGGKVILTQENTYNGNGQRIRRTETGESAGTGRTTCYYYQGDHVLYTAGEDGSRKSFHLYGLEGNVIASGRYGGGCAGQYLVYNKDLRGSTTSLLKPDGSCALSYQYTDFGETTRCGAPDVENEICYTGGIYDESTGLYYLNARYYAPQDGRFLSQDTYRGEAGEPATWNLYVYCADNPVGYVDPSGHTGETIAYGGGYLIAKAAAVVGSLVTIVGIGTVVVIAVGAVVHVGRKIYRKFQYERASSRTLSGYRVKSLAKAVSQADKCNRKIHILKPKHKWNKVVKGNPSDPDNWNKIKGLIYLTLAKGQYETYKGGPSRVYNYHGNIIQVVYKFINGGLRIVDAWIKR